MAGKEGCTLEFEKKKDLITNKRETLKKLNGLKKRRRGCSLRTGRTRETLDERGSSLSPRMSPSRASFFLVRIASKRLLRRLAWVDNSIHT